MTVIRVTDLNESARLFLSSLEADSVFMGDRDTDPGWVGNPMFANLVLFQDPRCDR